MLVFSRHMDEEIVVGDKIVVKILAIVAGRVQLGISAPANIPVHRKEVHDAIKNGRSDALIRDAEAWHRMLVLRT